MLKDLERGEKFILLVDPDEAFGRILQQVLGTGYTLRCLANVEPVISLLDDWKLDAILLNLNVQEGSSVDQGSCKLLDAASERAAAPRER